MDVNIVLDENKSLRLVKQGSGDVDLTNLTFYIPKTSYDTYSFSCILKQGDKDIIIPLNKTNTDHSIYYLHKCDLLPVQIGGTYQLFVNGINLSQQTSFISNCEELTLTDNIYNTSFQVYANTMLKSELATVFTKTIKTAEVVAQMYDDIMAKIGGES